jgi:hypothetical protein
MWLAHYSFHFFTSFDTVVPVTQRFLAGFGFHGLGPPNWICSCCRPAPDWLLKWELTLLDFGFLTSLYTSWRIADSEVESSFASRWKTLRIALPWAMLLFLLFTVGLWILLQPMQMRGTLPG